MQDARRTRVSSKQSNVWWFPLIAIRIKFLRLLYIGFFRKLSITAPFYKQNELKRPFDKLTAIEKVVIGTLLDAGVFKQWHSILLKEKEDNDEFSNNEFLLIKVHVHFLALFFKNVSRPAKIRPKRVLCGTIIHTSRISFLLTKRKTMGWAAQYEVWFPLVVEGMGMWLSWLVPFKWLLAKFIFSPCGYPPPPPLPLCFPQYGNYLLSCSPQWSLTWFALF